jgi:hypothetical protein
LREFDTILENEITKEELEEIGEDIEAYEKGELENITRGRSEKGA